MSLRKQAFSGVLWVGVERLGAQLIQMLLFIILARLLTPKDFGLIAMIIVFFEISQSFVDSGMGQALIRQKVITVQDRSTVFWFNLLLSFVFYALLFFTAPLIALFYEQPPLTPLIRVMGLAIIFYGIAIVQRAELTQQLQFKKQAYIQIPAMILSGAVSVILAFLDYGVWALVAQYLLLAFLSSIFLWIASPFKVLFKFNKESFKRLFGFGYKLLLSGLLDTVFSNIYKLVIGKVFSAVTLGLYTQAKKMQTLVSSNLVGIIQKVSYPILSKVNDNPEALKRGYRKVIQSSSFIIFPCILILFVHASPILVYVLGEKWVGATPFLQIVCISGLLYHLHAINLNILKVKGRSDLFLKLEVIKKVNITIAIFIGLEFGIYGLLIGSVISSYVALFINTYYTAKFINYSIFEQIKDITAVLLLSLPMLLIMYLLNYYFEVQSLLMLIVYLIVSVVIYIVSNLIFRTPSFMDALELVGRFIPIRIKNYFIQ
jgi:teichuronic acid exporter